MYIYNFKYIYTYIYRHRIPRQRASGAGRTSRHFVHDRAIASPPHCQSSGGDLAGQQLFCAYGPLYWGSNVVNAQGPVVFPLVYAHAHLTLPSHNPGQLVYMPLPLPPDDVIDDADDVERSPRSSRVGDAAMDLLQIRGDVVPDASLDLAVTPVKC